MRLINALFIFLLKGYKKWISPLLGNHCRFYPTCSEYAIEAFRLFSFPRAIFMTIWRLLRCHPFHPGGFDPVLKNTEKKSKKTIKKIKQGECS